MSLTPKRADFLPSSGKALIRVSCASLHSPLSKVKRNHNEKEREKFPAAACHSPTREVVTGLLVKYIYSRPSRFLLFSSISLTQHFCFWHHYSTSSIVWALGAWYCFYHSSTLSSSSRSVPSYRQAQLVFKMKYSIVFVAALAGSSSAMPNLLRIRQGVTESIAPEGPVPSDFVNTLPGTFGIGVMNITGDATGSEPSVTDAPPVTQIFEYVYLWLLHFSLTNIWKWSTTRNDSYDDG